MTDREAIALKPCPFCKGKAIKQMSAERPFVYCESCDANGPECDTIGGAVEFWNTRALTQGAGWRDYTQADEGTEMLVQSKLLIDEDYNEQGVCVGTVGSWGAICAVWYDPQDWYNTKNLDPGTFKVAPVQAPTDHPTPSVETAARDDVIAALETAGDWIEAAEKNGFDLGHASQMPWAKDVVTLIDTALRSLSGEK